jgi:predicted MFS family arabinose efflux permease
MNLGWTFGLALGGVLATRSFRALFLVDAATTLLFAAVIALRVPETRPAGTHPHSPLAGLALVFRDGPFVVFLLLHLLALSVFVQFAAAVPIDMTAHGVSPGIFAALLSVNGLGVVLLQPLSATLLAARDGARLLAASALLFGLGYGAYALADLLPPVPVYAAGVALWTLGEVVGFPVAAAVTADLAPADLRGRYQGAFSMCWGVAFTIAPLAAGEVLTRRGGRFFWLCCLAVGSLVAIGHLAAAGPRRRRLAALHARPAA